MHIESWRKSWKNSIVNVKRNVKLLQGLLLINVNTVYLADIQKANVV